MAQQTKTWSALTGLVTARLGHDLSSKEIERVGLLADSAALTLYDETPWWERFLVLEPRTVERGYVQFTEDSFNVFGAGTGEVNGLYTRLSGMPLLIEYELLDGDGDVLYEIQRENFYESWSIVRKSDAVVLYVNVSDPGRTTPPQDNWIATNGEEPAPLVQALSEIGEYIGHWNGAVFQCAGATPGTAYPDQNGIRITNCNADGVVYMAFKKTLTDTYGDGTKGTTSDIPAEWFNFMALQTASAWEGSQDRPTVRVKDINRAWEQALLKINRQGIYNNIASRFRTYYGCDVSVR